jgi:hypothetical protein
MTDHIELSQKEINALFDAMGKELANFGSEFAFVQLRVSAEHFVVPLFGLSVERVLCLIKPDQYHIYFEKKFPRFKQGPVDLVLAPVVQDRKDDLNNAYCFEFKMVWLNGIRQNLSGINQDIRKLSGYDRGYVIGVLFSFDKKVAWAPYSHEGNILNLVKEVISGVSTPMYEGQVYSFSNHEVAGQFKLIAWAAH